MFVACNVNCFASNLVIEFNSREAIQVSVCMVSKQKCCFPCARHPELFASKIRLVTSIQTGCAIMKQLEFPSAWLALGTAQMVQMVEWGIGKLLSILAYLGPGPPLKAHTRMLAHVAALRRMD